MVDFEWLSLSLISEEGSGPWFAAPAETFEDLRDLQNMSDGVANPVTLRSFQFRIPKLGLGISSAVD